MKTEVARQFLVKFSNVNLNKIVYPFSTCFMCTEGRTDRDILIGSPQDSERAGTGFSAQIFGPL
jgi:hypothetical protein